MKERIVAAFGTWWAYLIVLPVFGIGGGLLLSWWVSRENSSLTMLRFAVVMVILYEPILVALWWMLVRPAVRARKERE